MKLKSMALSKTEQDKMAAPQTADDQPRYPWGLSLTLDDETLEKLGFGDELPDVGAMKDLVARAKVTSVSSNDVDGGKKRRSVSLQITELACSYDGDKKSHADVLYGEKKG